VISGREATKVGLVLISTNSLKISTNVLLSTNRRANGKQNRDHENEVGSEESKTLIAGDECEGDEDQ